MRRGWIRRLSEFLALGISLVLAAAAFYVLVRPPTAPAAGEPAGSRAPVSGGSLKDTERSLLIEVRQAVLSEGPTGQQAQQRASTAQVKGVGFRIATDYADLGEQVLKVASQFHVILPSTPSEDQRRWMAELSARSGADYERAFVQRLRAAESKIYSLAAQVRIETKIGLIRDFAQRTLLAVEKHVTLLEGTGLVDFSALP